MKKITYKQFNILKKISIVLLIGLLMQGMLSTTILAQSQSKTEEEYLEDIKGYRDCIVRIESICENGDDDSIIYAKKTNTGFVVSSDGSGVYVLTIDNNLTFSNKEISEIRKIEKLNDNEKTAQKIEVIFGGDLRIPASLVGESEQRNLAVLKLSQAVHFDKFPVFSPEETEGEELNSNAIYLLSFPGSENENPLYNIENVQIIKGTRGDGYLEGEVQYFYHDIEADQESYGGLLLNQDGQVTGILLQSKGDNPGKSLNINEIRSFLSTFNIGITDPEEEIPIIKKIPIINLVLAVVIFILLIVILVRAIRNAGRKNAVIRQETRSSSSRPSGKQIYVNAELFYPDRGETIPINVQRFIIGRNQDCHLQLTDNAGISRQHACIEYKNNNFYLSDLGSVNHTYLNGKQIMPGEERVLSNKDEISVGKVVLIIRK